MLILTVGQVILGQLGGGHVVGVGAAAEQGPGGLLGLLGLLLAVDHFGELEGQDLLGFVELRALPAVHLVDLLQGQEGEHAHALLHVRVLHVAPVLVEVEGAGLFRVQPHGVARGLAHLFALGVGEQGDGHGEGVLAQLAADELGAPQHVGPLVVAAKLHVAAVVLVQVVEVVALHGHVVEFQEGEALLHALLEALGPEHVVDGEAGPDVPDEIDVIQVEEPIGVVHHLGLALAKLDEALHLLFEAGAVVLDGLPGHHGAHVRAAGGIADHGGAAADEGDGPVARHLQALHQGEGHEMAHVEAVRRGVEADVEHGLAVVDDLADLLLVGDLGDEAPGFQFFVDLHGSCSFRLSGGKRKRPLCFTEGDKVSRYHLSLPGPHGPRPHRAHRENLDALAE